jgi:hypothetical protein
MLDLDNNATFCYQKKLDNLKKHKTDEDLDRACKEYLREDLEDLQQDNLKNKKD